MSDRTIVRLVPRDTTPARPVDGVSADAVPPAAPFTRAGRLIRPMTVPPGTAGPVRRVPEACPGPLARALLARAARER